MEANKENKRTKLSIYTKTKIPVPVQPLPLIPKHVITKTTFAKRAPLKAIDFFNSNIALSKIPVQKTQEIKVQTNFTLKDWLKNYEADSKLEKKGTRTVLKEQNNLNSEDGSKNENLLQGKDDFKAQNSVKNEDCTENRFEILIDEDAFKDEHIVKYEPGDIQDSTKINDNDSIKRKLKDNADTTAITANNDSVQFVPNNDQIEISDDESDISVKVVKDEGEKKGLDIQEDHSIASIFSDYDDKHNTVVWVERLFLGKVDNIAVTPAALIEHRGVRNIKKSLKRPHSRELQGLSPAVSDNVAEGKAKRFLKFDFLEDKMLSADFSKPDANWPCPLSKSYTADIFTYLLIAESKPLRFPFIECESRACLINWLLRLNGANGNPAVIQSACWYLDSYLSSKVVNVLKLQAVGAACYWIAQKLHGPMFSAPKLVVCAGEAFTAAYLRVAEETIMRELKFPRSPIVPQEFITYLSWWCDKTQSAGLEAAATLLCMAGLMVDKSLCQEYPSVVAAVAVRTAVLMLGKIELMEQLNMCPVYQQCMAKLTKPSESVVSVLRKAVCTMSEPGYLYNVLLNYYNQPPHYVSHHIVQAVNSWAVHNRQ